ncbi:MAG: alcohol dehydrogenase catalytic domain-containing protein [Anaerolineae bacterium]
MLLGHETADDVVAVGKSVTACAPSDRPAIAPDIRCATCYHCRRMLVDLCDGLRSAGTALGYPGGFAERMALPGEMLTRGIVVYLVRMGYRSFAPLSRSPAASIQLATLRLRPSNSNAFGVRLL